MLTNKKNAFTFDMTFGDNKICYFFEITKLIPSEFDDNSDLHDQLCEEGCDEHDLESKYGVHDIAFGGPFKDQNGVEYNSWFGFDTYEVEEDQAMELMKAWVAIFEEFGYEVGEIQSFEVIYEGPVIEK